MSPSTTLPISRLINVQVNLTATAAQAQNFNSLLILGNSSVIDVVSRMRTYSTLTQVSTDFGTSAPEYLAAALWFAQVPQPTQLFIGRWAQTASKGQLFGGTLPAATTLATFTAIASGGFKITIDGGAQTNITGLNFTGAASLSAVAGIIQAALTGATCTYDSVFNRFFITSNSTGATSSISFLVAPATGTDISGTLQMQSTSSGAYQANGIAAESAVSAVTTFDTTFGQQWYALSITGALDADHQAVAAFIEGTTTFHFYGVSTQAAGVLNSSSTTDIAYLLSQSKYKRTAVQYSSSSLYSAVSLLGRILTVDYTANSSVITLMYKQEPTVTPETLNTTQIAALETKNCNVFVSYNNNTSIIEQGVCTSGDFIDTVIASHIFSNTVQTAVYNLLYTSTTKIPQTDGGMHQIITTVENVCSQFVANGWIAPGVWTNNGFGTLQTGQFMPTGFYVYAPPVSTQSTANRAARLAVPIQVAVKLAGAVHTASISVTVNP